MAGGGERQRFEGQARELGAALQEANRHKWRALRLLITPVAEPCPIMIKSEGPPAGSLAADAQALVHRSHQEQEQEQEQEHYGRRLAAALTIQRVSRARRGVKRGAARDDGR